MVSGRAKLQGQAGRARFGQSLVYILELTTGECVGYGVPSFANRAALGQKAFAAPLVPIDRVEFRNVQIRPQGADAPGGQAAQR